MHIPFKIFFYLLLLKIIIIIEFFPPLFILFMSDSVIVLPANVSSPKLISGSHFWGFGKLNS